MLRKKNLDATPAVELDHETEVMRIRVRFRARSTSFSRRGRGDRHMILDATRYNLSSYLSALVAKAQLYTTVRQTNDKQTTHSYARLKFHHDNFRQHMP